MTTTRPDEETLAVPPYGMQAQPGRAVPNAARIYDWLLGGKENYDADRQAARKLLRAVPGARRAARDNRAFLARAVAFLARQGITQFHRHRVRAAGRRAGP
jgi:hypothetical protein